MLVSSVLDTVPTSDAALASGLGKTLADGAAGDPLAPGAVLPEAGGWWERRGGVALAVAAVGSVDGGWPLSLFHGCTQTRVMVAAATAAVLTVAVSWAPCLLKASRAAVPTATAAATAPPR